jgi:hypothetical protein
MLTAARRPAELDKDRFCTTWPIEKIPRGDAASFCLAGAGGILKVNPLNQLVAMVAVCILDPRTDLCEKGRHLRVWQL